MYGWLINRAKNEPQVSGTNSINIKTFDLVPKSVCTTVITRWKVLKALQKLSM